MVEEYEDVEYDRYDDDEEEYYNDWLEDNSYRLRCEFCEDRENDFSDYCRKEFNNRKRD